MIDVASVCVDYKNPNGPDVPVCDTDTHKTKIPKPRIVLEKTGLKGESLPSQMDRKAWAQFKSRLRPTTAIPTVPRPLRPAPDDDPYAF